MPVLTEEVDGSVVATGEFPLDGTQQQPGDHEHSDQHMDAVVVMLEKGLALVCEDALPPYAIEWLDKQQISRIPVAYKDCVKLGGNLVSLGNKRVLSMSHNVNVNAQLETEGFDRDDAFTSKTVEGIRHYYPTKKAGDVLKSLRELAGVGFETKEGGRTFDVD